MMQLVLGVFIIAAIGFERIPTERPLRSAEVSLAPVKVSRGRSTADALHAVLKAGGDDRINHPKTGAEQRCRAQRLVPQRLELIEVVIAAGGGTGRDCRHRSLPGIKDVLPAVQQIEVLRSRDQGVKSVTTRFTPVSMGAAKPPKFCETCCVETETKNGSAANAAGNLPPSCALASIRNRIHLSYRSWNQRKAGQVEDWHASP